MAQRAMQLHDASALRLRIAAAGATPKQAARALRGWVRGRGLLASADRRDAPFARRLRAELAELEADLDGLARIVARERGDDGTDGTGGAERCVVELADGLRVEAVALPSGSACLSSQVGCAVGCDFCATGLGGVARNLTALEIAATFAALSRDRPLSRALFMGMGEPAHNAAAVLDAARLLAVDADLGRHHVVVSTVGDRRLFDALSCDPLRPPLALSLHAADDALRRELLPRAQPIPVVELVDLAAAYAARAAYPIQAQVALLAGVNDSDEQLLALADLVRGRPFVLNLIPWNQVAGLAFERPSLERCRAAVRLLMRAGVLAKLRWSAGLDASAACGQLVAARGR